MITTMSYEPDPLFAELMTRKDDQDDGSEIVTAAKQAWSALVARRFTAYIVARQAFQAALGLPVPQLEVTPMRHYVMQLQMQCIATWAGWSLELERLMFEKAALLNEFPGIDRLDSDYITELGMADYSGDIDYRLKPPRDLRGVDYTSWPMAIAHLATIRLSEEPAPYKPELRAPADEMRISMKTWILHGGKLIPLKYARAHEIIGFPVFHTQRDGDTFTLYLFWFPIYRRKDYPGIDVR